MYPVMSAFTVEFLTAHILIYSVQPVLGATLAIPAGNCFAGIVTSVSASLAFPLPEFLPFSIVACLHKGSK